MTEQEIKDIVTRQRKYFQTGAPRSRSAAALRRFRSSITPSPAMKQKFMTR